jgi:hypothetical protein
MGLLHQSSIPTRRGEMHSFFHQSPITTYSTGRYKLLDILHHSGSFVQGSNLCTELHSEEQAAGPNVLDGAQSQNFQSITLATGRHVRFSAEITEHQYTRNSTLAALGRAEKLENVKSKQGRKRKSKVWFA